MRNVVASEDSTIQVHALPCEVLGVKKTRNSRFVYAAAKAEVSAKMQKRTQRLHREVDARHGVATRECGEAVFSNGYEYRGSVVWNPDLDVYVPKACFMWTREEWQLCCEGGDPEGSVHICSRQA